ncbi:DNA-dependent ATPase mgs1, partial [Dimargaris xerosporica]
MNTPQTPTRKRERPSLEPAASRSPATKRQANVFSYLGTTASSSSTQPNAVVPVEPKAPLSLNSALGPKSIPPPTARPSLPPPAAATHSNMPLAELMRPQTFDDFYGQGDLVGPGAVLRTLVQHQQIPSLILWGPPGTGKTTLARLIAHAMGAYFRELSAVSQGLGDVKRVLDEAHQAVKYSRQRIIMFVDEVHRFNKTQQDFFLPFVEKGTITLIGATTENPSFKVNGALLSRCRVFVLHKLEESVMLSILKRALDLKRPPSATAAMPTNSTATTPPTSPPLSATAAVIPVEPPAEVDISILKHIAVLSDGDARAALNIMDIILNLRPTGPITMDDVKAAMQKSHLAYDQTGE